MDIPQICGQLIVSGFPGAELPKELADRLRTGRSGGVILFKRNLPTVDAAHELTSAVVDASADDLPPFIAVDEEGGRVSRLTSPVLRLPPMRQLGAIGDPTLIKRAASVLGRELSAIGFNLDFAPVLDVDSNPQNPVIGDRAFGSDPDTVARLGRAFVEGLQESGVLACGKHFPGHGDTHQDSHLTLPHVEHDKPRLDAVELPPFRTASLRNVATLMTAHVVYEKLDPGVPATLSRKICTTLLRNEIGFRGALFSDDLEMRALADHYTVEQSAVAAIRAGCDCVLICSDLELQARALGALIEKAESDANFLARCQEAANRCLAARRKCPPRPVPSVTELKSLLDGPEARALTEEIRERVAAVVT